MSSKKPFTNEECALFEFPNDKKAIAPGFIQWISSDDEKNIQDIIKQEKIIKVSWPSNYNVSEASKMNKLKDIKYTQYMAKVRAVGGKSLFSIINCLNILFIPKIVTTKFFF